VPALEISSWLDLEPLIRVMMDLQGGFLLIWYFIVMITIAFGLINTLFMSVYERIREIGLTQALGMTPALVLIQVLFESLILLMLGALLGNLLGWGTIAALKEGIDVSVFASATDFIGMRSIIYPYFYAQDWLAANLMILLLGILGSLYPAWKAARIIPAAALTKT
jgi:ABC-type lipoprotein release transport system permease subunit